jgi:zeta-carotene desaturase
VAAVPFDRLDRLASATMKRADRRLRDLGRLEVSPILGVHLWFDAPVMETPHLIVPAAGIQWLFDKGTTPEGLHHVHAVISGAEAWMRLDEQEIVGRVLEDVHRVLPRSLGLSPVASRCIKERRATFAATPGAEAHRPPVAPAFAAGPAIENLYLAGDWCDTGWPATMEGAVRSGYAAAAALTGTGGVVEDVPPGWLARLLGL